MKKRVRLNFTKLLPWIGFAVAVPSLILNLVLLGEPQVSGDAIKVLGVIDGDTIVLDGKVRLRLRHLDAPELEFCGGQEAKDLLTSLVEGQSVVVSEKILDQRGRPMALIYVGDELVNQAMLASGWVRYHSDQTSQREALKAANHSARKNNLGVFSQKCWQKENLANPGCNIKANIDKSTKVKKYYYPGCAQYIWTVVELDIGEAWFCSEKEAQAAGFVKADTCR
ncbi:MAG: Succinoglycan biosynthesis protein [Candidatus Beckwithbacteria bacterium GW2011_GWB1_47_15]|uniref:Succinoglycan biosynthesis protein n=1 Tax=Candidatus Beckwithbacteria bacterium GW2011_GWB1_47_15 TaxID=1618371 RepID=A0A0G1U6W9_9BACT|nr:MAG: nuclease, micrococcal nuclease [Candidatus Beckwithbacteria bacterium GW2011_GWC1_49_16]AQS30809.1 hypothetical protein [uncultured bacterium]KKU35994.1 MAG: Succinoglycan biosynthesis protein [Candidatus Beckwithbacteria bacterium GW2011_GWA1_46_30]KKU61958.1 MAG: Succinoglycan biosynthesis protein [Candidatus Beckwithbacteria bacterium GW2011_GWB1_47_15]KKU72488.1 MAG: Succinoglycan biosynthesis protein [Candidatus Beckwithbacteria bacterium GW2011_GWA2_47_25]KKW04345.1 MAG: Succinog